MKWKSLTLLAGVFLCHICLTLSKSLLRLSVPHNVRPGHVITVLPNNNGQQYKLRNNVIHSAKKIPQLFTVTNHVEVVTMRDISDFEGDSVSLLLENVDPSRASSQVLHINIQKDPPGIHFHGQPYVGHIKENTPAGTPLSSLSALYDSLSTFPKTSKLTLVSGDLGYFDLSRKRVADPKSPYSLVSRSGLDRELKPYYRILIRATDPVSSQEAYALVKISVDDENDNAPIFEKSLYLGRIARDIKPLGVVLRVRATDADQEPIIYSMDEDHPIFTIDPRSGEVLVKDPAMVRPQHYEFFVYARDFRGAHTTKVTVRLEGFQTAAQKAPRRRHRRSIRPPKVFVVSRRQTGDLFTVASVPSVPTERYNFQKDPPKNLHLVRETGMVSLIDSWNESGDVEFIVNITHTDNPNCK